MSKTTLTDLVCPECGNNFRIMRRTNKQKEMFHRKRMYCYVCKRITNHIEVKNIELFIADVEFSEYAYISPEKKKVYQIIKKGVTKMTVEELLIFGKSHCHSDHAKILLAELLNKNPLELLNYLEETVSREIEEKYKNSILALEEGKPLQYVLGKVNFYGIEFYINQNVLIPRFETEELVEQTINYINRNWNTPIDLIDLGCGSGVIGLTLEQKVNTNSVELIDISKEALEVTKKNKERLNSKAILIENNFLKGNNKKYDVIISNPPYIKTNEEIEEIVEMNEPHIALYAGEEGLDCYEAILKNIKNNMKDKCLIAFEIGYDQKEDIINLVNTYLQNVKIEAKQDLSGRDRMLFILYNIE